MTGLLQRLAARAAGTAWTVHSDARLPFAPAPQAVDEPQGAHGLAPVASASAPAVPPGTQASHRAPAPPAGIDAARPHVGHAGRPGPTPLWPARVADAAPAVATAQAQEADGAPPAGATPHPVARAKAGPHHAPVLPSADADRPALRATDQAASTTSAATTAPRADPVALLAPRATPMPTPHTASTPRRLAAPRPATAGAAAAAAASDAPEVHVHIGRIEVTAVHPAAPRQRPPRDRAPPMTLDAYLSRKKSH